MVARARAVSRSRQRRLPGRLQLRLRRCSARSRNAPRRARAFALPLAVLASRIVAAGFVLTAVSVSQFRHLRSASRLYLANPSNVDGHNRTRYLHLLDLSRRLAHSDRKKTCSNVNQAEARHGRGVHRASAVVSSMSGRTRNDADRRRSRILWSRSYMVGSILSNWDDHLEHPEDLSLA